MYPSKNSCGRPPPFCLIPWPIFTHTQLAMGGEILVAVPHLVQAVCHKLTPCFGMDAGLRWACLLELCVGSGFPFESTTKKDKSAEYCMLVFRGNPLSWARCGFPLLIDLESHGFRGNSYWDTPFWESESICRGVECLLCNGSTMSY